MNTPINDHGIPLLDADQAYSINNTQHNDASAPKTRDSFLNSFPLLRFLLAFNGCYFSDSTNKIVSYSVMGIIIINYSLTVVQICLLISQFWGAQLSYGLMAIMFITPNMWSLSIFIVVWYNVSVLAIAIYVLYIWWSHKLFRKAKKGTIGASEVYGVSHFFNLLSFESLNVNLLIRRIARWTTVLTIISLIMTPILTILSYPMFLQMWNTAVTLVAGLKWLFWIFIVSIKPLFFSMLLVLHCGVHYQHLSNFRSTINHWGNASQRHARAHSRTRTRLEVGLTLVSEALDGAVADDDARTESPIEGLWRRYTSIIHSIRVTGKIYGPPLMIMVFSGMMSVLMWLYTVLFHPTALMLTDNYMSGIGTVSQVLSVTLLPAIVGLIACAYIAGIGRRISEEIGQCLEPSAFKVILESSNINISDKDHYLVAHNQLQALVSHVQYCPPLFRIWGIAVDFGLVFKVCSVMATCLLFILQNYLSVAGGKGPYL